MKYYVMTLFPDMIAQGLNTSIIGKAIDKNVLSLECIDIRKFTKEKHGHVDDYPYGGGAGMVMQAQPVYDCYQHVCTEIGGEQKPRVIYLTPQGKTFNQKMSVELAKEENLVFLCGHYEGIDERVLDMIVTDHVSIGDYVLTGGELAAMVMIDSISRNIPGVLNNDISAETESFSDGLLEYPQYTRPEVFMDHRVPEVLLSGHHANIERWRREQSILRTYERRPDLFEDALYDKQDMKFIRETLGITRVKNYIDKKSEKKI
ncbi:MAG: tRNA (guanosine(37)-N1)-methyltransferase TrmD [Lachnospiraceae bacterium]|nr:tRNA (guanosine(37)-N1)-methyltransferase TrmD [Lachnospiraceae bacterium]